MKEPDDPGTRELFPDEKASHAPQTIRNGQPDLFGPSPDDPFEITVTTPPRAAGRQDEK